MSSPVPASLALSAIADGSNIVAADHRNNYAAIQTAMNAVITALSGGSAGQVLEAVSSSSVDWNGGAYQSYTPTWTAASVAPAVGNATTVAQYTRLGKFVHATGIITFGSTTTFGTGAWSFALPVPAATGVRLLGHAEMFDSSASAYATANAVIGTASTLNLDFATTYLGTIAQALASTPWTWATSDFVSWNLLYEAA